MTTLKRSRDRKVTNSVTVSGNARGYNSFGLPSGANFSCPGQTAVCAKVCYAGKLEKVYKGVLSLLMHNWELLKDADIPTMENLIRGMVNDFVSETDKAIAKGNVATYDFRIHWDGDFFSRDYAIAWANVIREFPNVRFWAYTRTFFVVDILAGIDNLSLYLSADSENMTEAIKVATQFPGVMLATLGDTFDEAKNAITVEGRKTYKCPENRGSIPLISEKGSACIACGICPANRGDVLFSVSKR